MRLKQEKDVHLTEKWGGVEWAKRTGCWGRGGLKYLNLFRKLKDAMELGGWPQWCVGRGG